jgi:hypothetical protein
MFLDKGLKNIFFLSYKKRKFISKNNKNLYCYQNKIFIFLNFKIIMIYF